MRSVSGFLLRHFLFGLLFHLVGKCLAQIHRDDAQQYTDAHDPLIDRDDLRLSRDDDRGTGFSADDGPDEDQAIEGLCALIENGLENAVR